MFIYLLLFLYLVDNKKACRITKAVVVEEFRDTVAFFLTKVEKIPPRKSGTTSDIKKEAAT